MLKLTGTVPCSSRRSFLNSGIHEPMPTSHVLTLSRNKDLKANQLGLLLSLKNRRNAKMDKIVCNSVDPEALCGGPPLSSWQGLIFGVVVTLILPYWKAGKLGSFLEFKNRVDRVIKSIETVEIVAEKVGMIANDIAGKLPDHGEIKNAVLLIEKTAKEIVKDAHTVETIIGKVKGAEETVESLFDQAAKEETKDVEDQA